MKNLTLLSAMLYVALNTTAHAACYADYKAKRDNPLKLHYGVIKISDETCGGISAGQVIAPRIARDGWTLLNVLGTFDETGLDRRRGNAGQYFLKY